MKSPVSATTVVYCLSASSWFMGADYRRALSGAAARLQDRRPAAWSGNSLLKIK
jgi:hypothetical protein